MSSRMWGGKRLSAPHAQVSANATFFLGENADMLRTPRIVFALLTILVSFSPCASSQVTSNVLLRVLLIKTPLGSGTAFSMDIDGRQYLITAKHMVKGWSGK